MTWYLVVPIVPGIVLNFFCSGVRRQDVPHHCSQTVHGSALSSDTGHQGGFYRRKGNVSISVSYYIYSIH